MPCRRKDLLHKTIILVYDDPDRYEIFHVLDFVDIDNIYILLHFSGSTLSPKIGHIEYMPDFILHTFTEDMKDH